MVLYSFIFKENYLENEINLRHLLQSKKNFTPY